MHKQGQEQREQSTEVVEVIGSSSTSFFCHTTTLQHCLFLLGYLFTCFVAYVVSVLWRGLFNFALVLDVPCMSLACTDWRRGYLGRQFNLCDLQAGVWGYDVEIFFLLSGYNLMLVGVKSRGGVASPF